MGNPCINDVFKQFYYGCGYVPTANNTVFSVLESKSFSFSVEVAVTAP